MNFIGQQIAHYQVKALLGQGRIGAVYQAVDLETQVPVALKTVSLHLAQQPEFRQQFLAEVRALPRLDHPAIVKVHEAGIDTTQDVLYLTMDYITGRSLSAYLQQLAWRGERLRVGDALLVVAQIAAALGYAHQKGVLHQDVRPNVILFRTPQPGAEGETLAQRAMIGDFALASLLEAETEPFAPSLPYMAPERCLGREADGRADIYSLGVVLFELVTGQKPFAITTLDDAIRCHTQLEPPDPLALRPELPPKVGRVILKAMARRASERYQTAEELAQELREVAAELPDSLAAPRPEEVRSADTVIESAAEQAIHISQWTSHEDRLSITQDLPRILNRRILTIGRGEDNDIVLPATSVTRRHAQLERTATGWQVRDLGSRNGTFLDGAALLPNIPMEILPHQILRIGPYYMQLQLGKKYAETLRPYDVFVSPTEVEIAPGRSRHVQVTITNQTTAVEEYALTVERLPAEWVRLSQRAVRLNPGERATLDVEITLPPPANGALNSALVLGKQQYLMVVNSLLTQREMIAAPGTLNVQSAADDFSLELQPPDKRQPGDYHLLLRNEGAVPQVYTVIGRSPHNGVRFAEWRPIETPHAAQRPAPGAPPRARKRGGTTWRRLSAPLRRLANAPRMAWQRLTTAPRRALNRLWPGLGTVVPAAAPFSLPKQPAPAAARTGSPGTKTAVSPSPFSSERHKKVTHPGDLQTQVQIPPLQQRSLHLNLSPRRRPLFGRQPRALPYEFYVATPNGRAQTITGQLEVMPRLRSPLWLMLLTLLLLLACLVAPLALARFNPTVAAFLAAPADLDNDGLSNFAEVYRYRTNPHLADTDGDGLDDGYEIRLGLNPNRADTDGDGLNDGLELQLGTNPLLWDTDGDTLSDGLEVLTLGTDPLVPDELPVIVRKPTPTPTPAPTLPPTAVPMPTAVPAPPVSQLTLRSLGLHDGTLLQEGGMGALALAAGPTLQVGDTAQNSQTYKAIVSFQTADLPQTAVVQSARLRLYLSERRGNPTALGQLHLDLAPADGFSGSVALENLDAVAAALLVNVATLQPDPTDPNWYVAELPETAVALFNWRGVTQFRVYYTLPNNNDGVSDLLLFASGDAPSEAQRPQLILTYNER